MPTPPAEPVETDSRYIPTDPAVRELRDRVIAAIKALPAYFRTDISIPGIPATDIHTLSNILGATLESESVRVLNQLRETWDPENTYALHQFHRRSQSFPDVRLQDKPDATPILGFDLKGWYLLAKEGEPSLRFKTTKAACAPQDLIVVVPWALSNVLSGTPVLFDPYIVSAQYAADWRTYYWQHARGTTSDSAITCPAEVHFYPKSKSDANDRPAHDPSDNFGRLARAGMMDDYIDKLDAPVCGIQVKHWRSFFKIFSDNVDDATVTRKIENLQRQIQRRGRAGNESSTPCSRIPRRGASLHRVNTISWL